MRRRLFEDVHEDFRASFRTFLEREVVGGSDAEGVGRGRYGDWERAGIVPREVFALAGRGGFLAMAVPERYGGAGPGDFRFHLLLRQGTPPPRRGRLRPRLPPQKENLPHPLQGY